MAAILVGGQGKIGQIVLTPDKISHYLQERRDLIADSSKPGIGDQFAMLKLLFNRREGVITEYIKEIQDANNTTQIVANIGSDIRILKIGIQAPPATEFQINGTPVRIGNTGIYELDYNIVTIDNLLMKVPIDSNNSSQTTLKINIIIDFIY